MQAEEFEIQVTTFGGLEDVLAKEVQALGGKEVKIAKRAIQCYGDLGFVYKLNYALRSGLRVLIPVHQFQLYSEKQYYEELLDFPWDDYIKPQGSFAINTSVHSSLMHHSKYAMYLMKDAIVDFFTEKYGERPDVDTEDPDMTFHLRINAEDEVSVSLDSSGEPLFKRGYRQQTISAPINEVLAAGLLLHAGWDGKEYLVDPMCGSGTFLIEAAMMACQIPPQLFRKEFGFMKWLNYDAALWEMIKDTRWKRVQEYPHKIIGYDIDAEAVSIAKANVKFAELEDFIEVQQQDFFTSKKEYFPSIMVCNPPYNERIAIDAEEFYGKMGTVLKHNYPNTLCWLISEDTVLLKNIGLKPRSKLSFMNGKLPCTFALFDIFEGKRNKGKG